MDPLASSFHSQEWEILEKTMIFWHFYDIYCHTGYYSGNIEVIFEHEFNSCVFSYHSVQQGIFWAEDDLEFRIWPQITGYSIENVEISPKNRTVIFPDYQTLSEAGSEKSGVSLKSYTEVLRKSPEFFNESIRGDWPKQKVKNDSDRSNRWSLKKKEINIRTDPKVSH